MSYSEGWGDKIEDPDYYARLGIHGHPTNTRIICRLSRPERCCWSPLR